MKVRQECAHFAETEITSDDYGTRYPTLKPSWGSLYVGCLYEHDLDLEGAALNP